MSDKWPLHPLPEYQESLSSWIRRIAYAYNFTTESLQKFDLEKTVLNDSALNISPSKTLLLKLEEKTGVPFAHILSMTFQTYVPLVIDSMIPQEDLYENYVCQFHTLSLAAKRRKIDFPNTWIPWTVRNASSMRGCFLCLQNDRIPYIRLYWQLSWLSCCPEHGIMLEEIIFLGLATRQFFCTEKLKKAPEEIIFIDQITQECLITGMAILPNKICISAPIWIRKIRGLLDEVSQPLHVSGVRSSVIIKKTHERVTNKSHCSWKPFEELPSSLRILTFQMAGIIMQEMLSGMPYSDWRIKRKAADTEFLYPTPIRQEDYPSYYVEGSKKSKQEIETLTFFNLYADKGKDMSQTEQDRFWEKATHDKYLAFLIRQALIKRKKSIKSIETVDDDLKSLGIPILDRFDA